MFFPDKNSPVGRWIWEPSLAKKEAKRFNWDFIKYEILEDVSKKWRKEIYIDPVELCMDFARVCGINPEILIEYESLIKELALKLNLNFGKSQGGIQE